MRKYSRLGVGNHGLNANAALASCLTLGKWFYFFDFTFVINKMLMIITFQYLFWEWYYKADLELFRGWPSIRVQLILKKKLNQWDKKLTVARFTVLLYQYMRVKARV